MASSSSSSKRELRTKSFISFIGHISNQIVGAKLPSNRQVLKVFFYNVRVVKLTTKGSADLVIQEVSVFWQKARIPTKRIDHCVNKLLKLYDEWKSVQKNLTRTTGAGKENQDQFIEKMDDLFDIAHLNALDQMKNEKDKNFLVLQRQKGRPGSMIGIDKKLQRLEENVQNRTAIENFRKKRTYDEMEQQFATCSSNQSDDLITSSNESSQSNEDDSENSPINIQQTPVVTVPTKAKETRGKFHFFTPRLAEVFDRCKLTDRNGVYILMAAAEAFSYDTENCIINRTSLQRLRKNYREAKHAEIRKNFKLNDCKNMVLHWDGKLLPALTGVGKVDRLAIMVTFEDKEQLLGIPEISTSSGEEQAMAVYQAVEKWDIADRIQALCCDTTASNTGRINGACTNLEKTLNRTLLYLPCRHHIFEVILRCCFDTVMGTISGPDVTIFKRFKESWSKFNTNLYVTGSNEIPDKVRCSTLQFLKDISIQKQIRDDYQELLELTIIFLGGIPARGISFRLPGAVSHARWMAKAIYIFKLYLFQNQFDMSQDLKNSVRRICIFLSQIYVRAWFLSPEAIKAPYHDFQFMRQLITYKEIDIEISNATTKKNSKHLWYLAPETVALSLFDENVPNTVKANMIQNMLQDEKYEEDEEETNDIKNYILRQNEFTAFTTIKFSSLVTSCTKNFFKRFSINSEFLRKDPSTWGSDPAYKLGIEKLKNIVVVNDVAERGVKLIQEYNNILSKDETEKQFILQIVADHRKRYPAASKYSLRKT